MAEDAPSKPAVLILGGCGFVGRNLVGMLVEKELCAKIRVVDKTMPAMAFLAPDQKAAFDSPIVEYVQGDLSRQAAVDKAFSGASFQYVFNLTYDGIPFGQADEVYQQRIVDICAKVGAAAAQAGIKRFVDLSTAQVYTSTEKAADESAKLKPWTKQASFKLQAEEALRALGLPLVVLRVATVYGRGDVQGLTPRVICAAVYKHLNEKMKFLWDSKLRINTVHVGDVCAALWHVATLGSPQPVYNVCDQSDSNQGSINQLLERIFGISTAFAGNVASSAVKALGFKSAAEAMNEKHMEGWATMCKAAGILNTPLTPYLDPELLAHNHLAVDGRLITSTGFTYAAPQLTEETLRPQVATYVQQQLFPPLAGGGVSLD